MKRLLIVLLGGIVAAFCMASADAAQAGQTSPAAKYIYLELKGAVPDALPPLYLVEPQEEPLHAILERIHRAKRDPQVRGLIVRVGSLEAAWAKVQELRDALQQCRAADKEVVCLLDTCDTLTYYLATAADKIVLQPGAQVILMGLRAEAVFAKDLLDKVGVKGDFVEAGKYKGAGEPFTRNEPSILLRESIESVLKDYYEQLLDGLAKGRSMPVSRAAAAIRGGPFTASQAVSEGLVDGVAFYDEVLTELDRRHDGRLVVDETYAVEQRPPAAPSAGMNLLALLMGGGRVPRAPERGAAIAVIYASGPIMELDEGLGLLEQAVTVDSLTRMVRDAVQDDSVKAIVLRIDSPGGSASACDLIWRELRLADRVKPVIASLSDTAASGGYYIAAGARKIYAEPGTLTGSIGVVGGKLVLSGLFQKLGLHVAVFEHGGDAGIASAFEELTPAQRRKLEALVGETYRIFLARVAETRPGMSPADVDRVAQGRLWTGRQANQNGLVDALGGLSDAIAAAREAAGIPPETPVRLIHLPRPRSLIEAVLFGGGSQVRGPTAWDVAGVVAPASLRQYVAALMALKGEPALCILPAVISVR